MENPFDRPAPTELLERVTEFARDLAYGAAQGYWHTRIQWQKLLKPEISKHGEVFTKYLGNKWGTDFPSEFLMLSFGYLKELELSGGISTYLLTDKAFLLLQRPTTPPNVFISYRRSESSPLALLIEARLKLAGNPNPFIDKNLVAGEDWEERLQERISHSRYFVCLISKTTLESPQVQQEIAWADEYRCSIISMWHGCKVGEDASPILRERHAIFVNDESALGYETAINQLLNSMGYATY